MENQDLAAVIVDIYRHLQYDNLDRLNDVYADNVIFEDPAHRIEGMGDLRTYFENLYRNVNSCTFDFERVVSDGQTIFMAWTMQLSHPKLRSGEQLFIPGCSMLLVEEDQIHHHRDYFDMGKMVYEHVPVLGWAVTRLKERLGA